MTAPGRKRTLGMRVRVSLQGFGRRDEERLDAAGYKGRLLSYRR
jgi:hypothetical protein